MPAASTNIPIVFKLGQKLQSLINGWSGGRGKPEDHVFISFLPSGASSKAGSEWNTGSPQYYATAQGGRFAPLPASLSNPNASQYALSQISGDLSQATAGNAGILGGGGNTSLQSLTNNPAIFLNDFQGGRLFVSLGKPLEFAPQWVNRGSTQAPNWQISGYAAPTPQTSDANSGTLYQYFEPYIGQAISGSGNGNNADISYIDFFSFPITLTSYDLQGSRKQSLNGGDGDALLQAAVNSGNSQASWTRKQPNYNYPWNPQGTNFNPTGSSPTANTWAAPAQSPATPPFPPSSQAVASRRVVSPGLNPPNNGTVPNGGTQYNSGYNRFGGYLTALSFPGQQAGSYQPGKESSFLTKGQVGGPGGAIPELSIYSFNAKALGNPSNPFPSTGNDGGSNSIQLIGTITGAGQLNKGNRIRITLPWTQGSNPNLTALRDGAGIYGANAGYSVDFRVNGSWQNQTTTNSLQNDIYGWVVGEVLAGLNYGLPGSPVPWSYTDPVTGQAVPGGSSASAFIGTMPSQAWWSADGPAANHSGPEAQVASSTISGTQVPPPLWAGPQAGQTFYNGWAYNLHPLTDAYTFALADRIGGTAIDFSPANTGYLEVLIGAPPQQLSELYSI